MLRTCTAWPTANSGIAALSLLFTVAVSPATGAGPDAANGGSRNVPMHERGASTYYVPCHIEGYGELEMLVDTGSAYMTINEQTLGVLKEKGLASYVREFEARLANGATTTVPIYRIATVTVGNDCELQDVEAAVLPGSTRSLLGLSALNKASPIVFSSDPPELTLSGCRTTSAPRSETEK